MNQPLRATVLIPTIKNRGPLLTYSVGSVLGQTISEIEVFIMGDGVDEETRTVIHDLMDQDSRIKFFDNPKHERRGEPNRHKALAEAQGTIVCYLCDRDLMLPNHIETVEKLLIDADFCHTLMSMVVPKRDRIRLSFDLDLSNAVDRHWLLREFRRNQFGIPLSFVAHTLDMYRKLPHGWRTTPENIFTDLYMWEQFLSHSECRAVSGVLPTILYFPRTRRADWSVEEKHEELKHWTELLENTSWNGWFLQETINALVTEKAERARHSKRRPIRRAYWKLIKNFAFKG